MRSVQLLAWFVLMAVLGLAGFWFFRAATPLSTAALAIAVMLYLGGMVASVCVSVRRNRAHDPCPYNSP
jgi:hypothetical protein